MERDLELIRDLQFLEELEEIEEELQPHRKIPRVNLIDAQNPLEYYNGDSFHSYMAFTKEQFLIVLDIFKDTFATSIPAHSPLVQLTVFLRYVKSNNFLKDLCTQTVVQLPISDCHEIVNSVAGDIASYSETYIVYPSVEEQNTAAARVLEKYNFPGCPKVLDGCQIKIRYYLFKKSSQMFEFYFFSGLYLHHKKIY